MKQLYMLLKDEEKKQMALMIKMALNNRCAKEKCSPFNGVSLILQQITYMYATH